ncbi:hypothetical protein [Mesorhizobium sp.]|uniref:hypothetical protein n=1 Tax=Mesorhizobium sp. TaxID=1871066 RepID=UPI00257DCE65|nr:hypothetical protein [Mesorhizobium sp.]
MEIVPHKSANWPEIALRDFGSPGEDSFAVRWQMCCHLDGDDDSLHLVERGRCEEDRNVGKQMRPCRHESFAEARLTGFAIQRRPKFRHVERDAEAFAVESL